MATLTSLEITRLLQPYLADPVALLVEKLSAYLDLLLKWNARTNLTAIRDPREIVTRHFGESLFAAQHLGTAASLLDYGSGAGFPGLPIALFFPHLHVTLAESQNKKVAFLREACRVLGLETSVWPRRVEDMDGAAQFDCITLRAVDAMVPAILAVQHRAKTGMILLTTRSSLTSIPSLSGFTTEVPISLPGSDERVVLRLIRH